MATTHADEPVDAAALTEASAARLGISVAVLAGGAPGTDADDSGRRYINREVSTLDYYARVLAIAEDATVPLLERVKFLAIFSGLLDEFFEVRVAGLKDQLVAGLV
ncbi:MAG: RNA degradosome polyphosphate kinase, partial [Actinomycetota bacterium]|nr:RNA degradosome polyphosphate kinase [Actinomycetota bacterium]